MENVIFCAVKVIDFIEFVSFFHTEIITLCLNIQFQADTDVVKTSLGCLKKVTSSYDQTRRR